MGVAVDLTTEVGTVKSIYGAVTSVPSSNNIIIATYTVPVGKTAKLQRIEFSGTNIAKYTYRLNDVDEAQRHTWFNGPMFGDFNFVGSNQEGVLISAGDKVDIRGAHSRPDVGDFSARIQVLEID